MRSRFTSRFGSLGLIYLIINGLFVVKYTQSISPFPLLTGLAYVIVAAASVYFPARFSAGNWLRSSHRTLVPGIVVCGAVVLTVLMRQFDPSDIASGRYPAVLLWLERLFDGVFPYGGGQEPSGFPFLFVLTAPFYLIGDIGLLQIVAFAAFGWTLARTVHEQKGAVLIAMAALLASPAFVYEVVTRSELFSNMVAVILYLHLCRPEYLKRSAGRALLWGGMAGLLLATRGTVLPVLVLFGGYLFRQVDLKRAGIWGAGAVLGFLIVVTPFLIWDADAFFTHGPLSIQTSYMPTWAIGIAILIAVGLALTVRRLSRVYFLSAVMLFVIVAVAFVIKTLSVGLTAAVWGDAFDISYFCFVTPFVLVSFAAMSEEKQNMITDCPD